MKMKQLWRIGLAALLLLTLWTSGDRAAASSSSQTAEQAQAILDEMSVAERVGQLFLVPFEGDTISLESDIADLILNYHVGGVILRPENDNLTGYGNPANIPQQVASLSNGLQQLAILGEFEDIEPDPIQAPTEQPLPFESSAETSAIPLFVTLPDNATPDGRIGLPQGFAQVPTYMGVGATWEPIYASQVGGMVGQELAASGINLLLGPRLDVAANPVPGTQGDLGTSIYGGNAYWAGEMGRAFIHGVHEGSQQRVGVVASHFPGIGRSDRDLENEIPTIRRSLAELEQEELVPFAAVAGNSAEDPSVADGFLSSHIRYEGFQGSVQPATAPISLDPQALNTLMAHPNFQPWREQGGIVVSDALGTRSVERFYDSTEQEFPHRRVSRDALLAGNDLLYLGDFALGDAPYEVQAENIRDTLLWFQSSYEDDPSFRQRVDEAVLRILQLKLKLYGGDFSLANVQGGEVERVSAEASTFNLAQNALTLLSPGPEELAQRLSTSPGVNDSIVIFTDVRTEQPCSDCPDVEVLSETALEERLLALYGPGGSEQLQPTQIRSFSFADLNDYLDADGVLIEPPTTPSAADGDPTPDEIVEEGTAVVTPTPPPGFFVQEAIGNATWIIFNLLDVNGNVDSQALNRFLELRPDLVNDTRVIAFAYDAPTYLDSTEISQLTAYFGVYATTDAFINAAARALFNEATLTGASPVSVLGTGYELAKQTQPSAEQVIELFIAQDDALQSPPSQSPLDLAVGDTLTLQTGTILDRNGKPVPDGTLVRFIQRDRIQGAVTIIGEVPTDDGSARLDYVLEASTGPGQFRITAESGDALVSDEVDIIIEGGAQVAILEPTPTVTPTPTEPPPTLTAEPSNTATPPATATPAPPLPPEEPGIRIGLSELEMVVSLVVGLALTTVGIWLFSQRQGSDLTRQMALIFWGLIGGLLLYVYFQLGLPGSDWLLPMGNWAALITTLLGGLAGFGLYQVVAPLRLA